MVQCGADEFQCADNKTCIQSTWKCDGEPDCEGGEDEKNCKFCVSMTGKASLSLWLCVKSCFGSLKTFHLLLFLNT